MSFPEPYRPFDEYEERHLLAEMIRKSHLPTQALLGIIRDAQIEPQWTEIILPYGRSVSACQSAYHNLQTRSAQDPQSGMSFYRRSLTDPDLERANAAGRELQPRPLLYPGSVPPISLSGFRFGTLDPPPRKKRGRPSKEEFERRAAEARARGEEYPKRRPKAQKRSAADTPGSGTQKTDSVASPTESRPGPPSVLSPDDSRGLTSTSQSAVPLSMQSPQSNPAPDSTTSVSEASSQGPQQPCSAPPSQPMQAHPPPCAPPGADFPYATPTFPNQETGYGFSMPPATSREHPKETPVTSGGPSVPHPQISSVMPARDPYGYYPKNPSQSYRPEGPFPPGG